jgi:hypothetical protein
MMHDFGLIYVLTTCAAVCRRLRRSGGSGDRSFVFVSGQTLHQQLGHGGLALRGLLSFEFVRLGCACSSRFVRWCAAPILLVQVSRCLGH